MTGGKSHRGAQPAAVTLVADRLVCDGAPAEWSKAMTDTAQRLLDSATEAFAAKGFHGTTTRDIAFGAGVTPERSTCTTNPRKTCSTASPRSAMRAPLNWCAPAQPPPTGPRSR
ncbi:TetR/AcrR family transcriptional regulator [Arthrobacter sp. ATA002]|uniref:TetR/AcrR family transcriptional regulator n=1 Tax=Arthrobacter sp. ATA002 TaxID=2991715 RepID=UPI003FA428E0